MTEDQIKHMVDRFLCWKLPEDFWPDAGISFKPTFNEHLPTPMKHEPSGTNLFSATQADAMVRYMLEEMPVSHISALEAERDRLREALESAKVDVMLLLGAVQANDPNAELRVRCEDILRRAATTIGDGQ